MIKRLYCKHLVFISCLIFCLGETYGQKVSNNSAKIEALVEQAHTELRTYNYDKAIEVANQSLSLADSLDHYEGTVNSLFIIAQALKSKIDYSGSLNYYLQALDVVEKRNDTLNQQWAHHRLGELFHEWNVPEKALVYYNRVLSFRSTELGKEDIKLLNSMGEVHLALNQRKKALEKYNSVLEIEKSEGNRDQIISTYKKIASIYYQLGDYQNSLQCHFEILKINQSLKDSINMAISYNTIGYHYKDLKNLDQSLSYYKAALDLNKQMNRNGLNDNNIVSNLINIGVIYQQKGELRDSRRAFNEALKIKERSGTPVEIAVMHNYLATIEVSSGQFRDAEMHTQMAINLLKDTENKRMLATNYKRLSEINQKQNDYKSALENYEKYSLVKDSLLYREQVQQAQEKHKSFVIESAEKESKLNIIDHEMQSLELRNEKINAEKEKQEVELLLREKELQNAALQNEQLDQERQLQSLLLEQQKIDRQRQNQEILLLEQKRDLQNIELQKNELQEKERLRELELKNSQIELQESDLQLKEAQLEKSSIRQRYLIYATVLALGVIALGILAYLIKQRDNNKLKAQYLEIQKQKEQIENINAELVQLNEEKNDLISIVAHDLKSPLNQISGMLDIIKLTSKKQDQEQQDYIARIDQSTSRLKRMVSKILDVSAIESKTLNVTIEEVDINVLLDEVVKSFDDMAAKKEIEIVENLPAVSNVKVDRGYATEVLENLMSNAVKYSPIGKKINVGMEENGEYVKIGFSDEGQGINKEDMKKLFGKYHKLSARPTAGEDSTGLGLSIVKKYVEALNGKVWCESVEGEGATFFVEFKKA
ncbi:tetratricopeptide repeat-containing sensor histidine kinase [Fulvivirga lutimaris]|uniref:tetratricopeptide repeat-containing sensor histidine kinase n=1 Tax=Fulvivirga lutimaris TaxID=1819566 RepID=UPI0012BC6ED7|nr:tetratricopeptide repeat-containing sensor histidine kinase [Fulvivirga lutimaris]MTI41718.1 tetratricopeptide repeat protein [Fulvivirga lutimaris]